MAVGPATVVGHGGRHGARRLVVKSDKFSRDVQFCKMIKKSKRNSKLQMQFEDTQRKGRRCNSIVGSPN
jgi:hypothetical protein